MAFRIVHRTAMAGSASRSTISPRCHPPVYDQTGWTLRRTGQETDTVQRLTTKLWSNHYENSCVTGRTTMNRLLALLFASYKCGRGPWREQLQTAPALCCRLKTTEIARSKHLRIPSQKLKPRRRPNLRPKPRRRPRAGRGENTGQMNVKGVFGVGTLPTPRTRVSLAFASSHM